MNNVKTISITTEGNGKRMAITFDVVDESGKVTASNKRINRVVVDETVLEAIKVVDTYAQNAVDAE